MCRPGVRRWVRQAEVTPPHAHGTHANNSSRAILHRARSSTAALRAASRSEWVAPFTGLELSQFRKLVRSVARRGGDEIADGRPSRQWRLDLPDRVLLVATYWRTNLTMRQLRPLFGCRTPRRIR